MHKDCSHNRHGGKEKSTETATMAGYLFIATAHDVIVGKKIKGCRVIAEFLFHPLTQHTQNQYAYVT